MTGTEYKSRAAGSDESPPRFLADAMLGKLARWLRFLGFDTLYLQADDHLLAHRARAEDRILLTRDRELAKRRGLRSILIVSQDLEEQLVQILTEVGEPSDKTPARCMRCNVPLVEISLEEASTHVPPYVAQTQEEFRQCPQCGKVYWHGSHWKSMQKRLREVLESGEKTG
ncbi:MAG: Mut7-C RNAse domain-containing protein [Anaerolineae bacterium]